jgi:hypothetical protein
MRKIFIAATTAAVILVAASPAFATLITYELVGVTATEPNGLIDTLTGTFTVDTDICRPGVLCGAVYTPPFNYMSNIQVFDSGTSGLVAGGLYSLGATSAPSELHLVNPSQTFLIAIDFGPNLGTGDEPSSVGLINYYTYSTTSCSSPCGGLPNGGLVTFISSASGVNVTGEAIPIAFSPTPLPAALPLFATGLGAMGLIGWRRKRKARAVVA